jgi:hypothetical protein
LTGLLLSYILNLILKKRSLFVFKEKKMMKKSVLALLLAAVVVAGAFAQEDFESVPKNTVTVDIGPIFVGAMIGQLGKLMGDDGPSTSGFGIAAQYERQIFERFSVAGRFAYLGAGLGITEEGDYGEEVTVGLNFKSFSLEGHARYYPFKKTTFFLDGMLGYAYMSSAFSGEVVVKEEGYKSDKPVNFTASRNFIKLGAKIGWRFDFGKPGGFTFEPSFGYYYGFGIGDTVEKQLEKKLEAEVEGIDTFKMLENYLFIGGPRLTLSFGWRF